MKNAEAALLGLTSTVFCCLENKDLVSLDSSNDTKSR